LPGPNRFDASSDVDPGAGARKRDEGMEMDWKALKILTETVELEGGNTMGFRATVMTMMSEEETWRSEGWLAEKPK
jgi:hypothetical protein